MEYYDGAKASHLYRRTVKKNLFPASDASSNCVIQLY
jgi:hypothetical protein